MSESKQQWTPGPYESVGKVVFALEHDSWRKGEEQLRNRIYASVQHHRDCPEEEAEAVARLWGASPELVEALRRVVNHFGEPKTSAEADAMDAALAALAKAGAIDQPRAARIATRGTRDRTVCSFCLEPNCNGECSGDGGMGG